VQVGVAAGVIEQFALRFELRLLAGDDVRIEVTRLGQFKHLEGQHGKEHRQHAQPHHADDQGVEVGEGGISSSSSFSGYDN